MNEQQQKSLQLLKEYCKGDEDRLALLEKSIINGNIKIDEDGRMKYTSEYILADKELQYKTMPADVFYMNIKVGVINLINWNTDCEVKDGDPVVEKLSNFIVENIKRAISNNTTIEYWETLNKINNK